MKNYHKWLQLKEILTPSSIISCLVKKYIINKHNLHNCHNDVEIQAQSIPFPQVLGVHILRWRNPFPAAFAIKNHMLLYRMRNIAVTAELNNTGIINSSVLSATVKWGFRKIKACCFYFYNIWCWIWSGKAFCSDTQACTE